MTKRFSVIYALSFLCVLPLTYARPFVTARTWADVILVFSACCGVYELVYILWLRRKDGVSLGRAISHGFFCFFFALFLRGLLHFARIFFIGYEAYDMLGRPLGRTIRGIDALAGGGLEDLVYLLMMCISAVFDIIYIVISKMISKRRRKNDG